MPERRSLPGTSYDVIELVGSGGWITFRITTSLSPSTANSAPSLSPTIPTSSELTTWLFEDVWLSLIHALNLLR
jgi:hypothetical protein